MNEAYKNRPEESIKILRAYARVIEIVGIITMVVLIIPWFFMGDFKAFLLFVVLGVLSFLSSKVIAAFIRAYANQCEDVHNIYMHIKQS